MRPLLWCNRRFGMTTHLIVSCRKRSKLPAYLVWLRMRWIRSDLSVVWNSMGMEQITVHLSRAHCDCTRMARRIWVGHRIVNCVCMNRLLRLLVQGVSYIESECTLGINPFCLLLVQVIVYVNHNTSWDFSSYPCINMSILALWYCISYPLPDGCICLPENRFTRLSEYMQQ